MRIITILHHENKLDSRNLSIGTYLKSDAFYRVIIIDFSTKNGSIKYKPNNYSEFKFLIFLIMFSVEFAACTKNETCDLYLICGVKQTKNKRSFSCTKKQSLDF